MEIRLRFVGNAVFVVLSTDCNDNSQLDGDHSFYLSPSGALAFAQQIIDKAHEANAVLNAK